MIPLSRAIEMDKTWNEEVKRATRSTPTKYILFNIKNELLGNNDKTEQWCANK